MNRKDFIKTLAVLPFTTNTMNLKELKNISDDFTKSDKMPVLFIGHGSPMNAILDNNFTQHLSKISQNFERPNAILVISAHWLTTGKTFVSVNPSPKTIYDFGGFPAALYQVKYEPKGSPEMAKALIKEVKSMSIIEEHERGLDHGAWTVLRHIYPDADVPVFQMSIDYSKPPQFHYELAKELQNLRKKGVLILGSGNIVHNLRQMDWQNPAAGFDWAKEFDEIVKTNINSRNFQQLVDYQALGSAAKLSIPTPDHYYPMLYSLGLSDKNEEIKYTYEGLEMGSISMRCFQAG
jgi:4,5-DOPA dioxygenase extradiol